MKKKILLVDDEASLTKLVKLNLERAGEFEVMTENSGCMTANCFSSTVTPRGAVLPGDNQLIHPDKQFAFIADFYPLY